MNHSSMLFCAWSQRKVPIEKFKNLIDCLSQIQILTVSYQTFVIFHFVFHVNSIFISCAIHFLFIFRSIHFLFYSFSVLFIFHSNKFCYIYFRFCSFYVWIVFILISELITFGRENEMNKIKFKESGSFWKSVQI
jgi:hypothetical protein